MMCEFDGTSALSCATSIGRLSMVGSGGGAPAAPLLLRRESGRKHAVPATIDPDANGRPAHHE